MLGPTHMLSGSVAYLAAAPWLELGPARLVAGTVVAAYAALGPDLDHAGSTVARSLGLLRRPVSWLVSTAAGGHRAGTHSLLCAGLVGYLVAYAGVWVGVMAPGWGWGVQAWLGWAVSIGWVAAVAGDWLTPQGVELLWPVSRRSFRAPMRVRTGGWGERLVSGLLLVCGVWLVLVRAGLDGPLLQII